MGMIVKKEEGKIEYHLAMLSLCGFVFFLGWP